ncbi:phosphoribosylaminoimidazolesuccinocarboxamide synthase [Leptolyngbya sp. KIOST-1]|uniref:phosphoribosylaminoimidazolesuccinocarboxamide synthase n=1 Tax=Leptolyngbya sp. KIOST-1 TaxID=1229172 RepID=UPI00056AEE3D|nr:phosphoribosylaminoimidazolesuccinocarboxamide synthase [Leptolyngbya sp. KIOST-1]
MDSGPSPSAPFGEKRYEGKAKIIYATDDPAVLVTYFKDDATAFNAQKRGQIVDKGPINCAISTYLFKQLEAAGIATHWLETTGNRTMRVKALTIIPLEVVVRNLAAGSLCKQTNLPLGQRLEPTLVEFYYKDDALGDPLLTGDRIRAMGIASEEQIATLRRLALSINQVLTDFFQGCAITLVDFKLEFGLDGQGQILLGDEISPDTCRLWDQSTDDAAQRVLDKDRFRQDLGQVEAAYQRVLEKVAAQSTRN